ncbi:hypothetical protein Goklo_004101, partial [Gossypium klotzschianum]|nr:hypothetical protein [Gossypium klotzschianum]
ALVERWRLETQTFHLSCGECTITLEDVHLQLGLPWTGWIEMVWLRNNFAELAKDSTKERIERYTRAYILQIIEGILMQDKSQNLVHLRWLLKLVNFRGAGELSWGSAVLATLYREMCRAIKPKKIKIGGSFYYYNHEFGEEAKRRHPHTNRPRRLPSNSRGGKAGPSSSPTQEPTSTTLIVGHLSSMWYTLGPSHFPMIVTFMMMYRSSMYEAPAESTFVILSTYGTPHSYAHQQTPLISLFYQGGSSFQPLIYRLKDTRMQGSTSTKGKPRQTQPCPEAKPRMNLMRNHQPP